MTVSWVHYRTTSVESVSSRYQICDEREMQRKELWLRNLGSMYRKMYQQKIYLLLLGSNMALNSLLALIRKW
jgi:hypothetical protein